MSKENQVAVIEQQNTTLAQATQPTPMGMLGMAMEQGADLDKLGKLMDLQERWEKGEAKKAFYSALSAFQAKCPVIKKSGHAGFAHKNGGGSTEYSYARLEDIAKVINPLLADSGLSYTFRQSAHSGLITIRCVVSHSLGHQEETELSASPDQSGKKNSIQQVGSTISYLRRYTLTAALGITVGDDIFDDDGQAVEPEPVSEHMSQAQFDKSLPLWRDAIESGKRTTDQVFKMVEAKGMSLSPEQVEQVNQIGENK